MPREIDIDEKIIRKNRIPILIKDESWKSLFSENQRKGMEELVDNLEELMDEEKELEKLLKSANREKKILLNKVLKLSDEANSNDNMEALDKLEYTKNKILEVSDKIDEIQFRLEILPKEMYDLNLELLKKTISISYEDIMKGRKRVNYLDVKIEKLRKVLGEMWEEKFEKEKRINELYLYLHGVLGHEETDKLDKKFL